MNYVADNTLIPTPGGVWRMMMCKSEEKYYMSPDKYLDIETRLKRLEAVRVAAEMHTNGTLLEQMDYLKERGWKIWGAKWRAREKEKRYHGRTCDAVLAELLWLLNAAQPPTEDK